MPHVKLRTLRCGLSFFFFQVEELPPLDWPVGGATSRQVVQGELREQPVVSGVLLILIKRRTPTHRRVRSNQAPKKDD